MMKGTMKYLNSSNGDGTKVKVVTVAYARKGRVPQVPDSAVIQRLSMNNKEEHRL